MGWLRRQVGGLEMQILSVSAVNGYPIAGQLDCLLVFSSCCVVGWVVIDPIVR